MIDDFEAARLFSNANMLSMAGWLVLVVSIALRWNPGRDLVAGLIVPAVLSLGYVAIIAVHWSSAQGGFSSLSGVSALFQSPWMLLAGWVHFLAFDLFLGAWIAREADRHGISRWLVIPIMPLTLLFGPMGLVAWLMLRFAAAPSQATAPGMSAAKDVR